MREQPGTDNGSVVQWATHIGVTGVIIFALFAFMEKRIANIGVGLMLLAMLLDWRRFWRALRGDPALLLLLWTLAAVGISIMLRVSQYPAELPEQLDGMHDVLQLFLFLPMAWWLGGNQRLILVSLALALSGFVLGVYLALDGEELALLIAFQRPHFLWSINAVGQYAAACLLGMLILTPRYWRWLAHRRWRWAGMLGWLALMTLAGTGLLLSLSRGVWLATAIVVAGLILYLVITHTRHGVGGRQAVVAMLVGVALVLGALNLSNPIHTRVVEIAEPIIQFWEAEGHAEKVTDPSVRWRTKLITLGLQSWRESPWFGYGPAAPRIIMQANRDLLPGWLQRSDFHSLAIDMLTSFGLLGTLPLLLTFVLVLWVAHRGYRLKRLDRDVYLALVSLLVLSALSQMTDTRMLSSHGRFFSMLIAGASYSWWLTARAMDGSPSRPSAAR